MELLAYNLLNERITQRQIEIKRQPVNGGCLTSSLKSTYHCQVLSNVADTNSLTFIDFRADSFAFVSALASR